MTLQIYSILSGISDIDWSGVWSAIVKGCSSFFSGGWWILSLGVPPTLYLLYLLIVDVLFPAISDLAECISDAFQHMWETLYNHLPRVKNRQKVRDYRSSIIQLQTDYQESASNYDNYIWRLTFEYVHSEHYLVGRYIRLETPADATDDKTMIMRAHAAFLESPHSPGACFDKSVSNEVLQAYQEFCAVFDECLQMSTIADWYDFLNRYKDTRLWDLANDCPYISPCPVSCIRIVNLGELQSRLKAGVLYFYPSFVLYFEENSSPKVDFDLWSYTDIQCSVQTYEHMESDRKNFPPDNQWQTITWAHTCKDGKRDERYSDDNNTKYYVFEYGAFHIQTPKGHVSYITSQLPPVKKLADALYMLKEKNTSKHE